MGVVEGDVENAKETTRVATVDVTMTPSEKKNMKTKKVRKLRTSTMEMEMREKEEENEKIELRAWLERDDRKFEQLKKKRKALEKATTDSCNEALNALFDNEEDQEDQEEEEKTVNEGKRRRRKPTRCGCKRRRKFNKSWPSLSRIPRERELK